MYDEATPYFDHNIQILLYFIIMFGLSNLKKQSTKKNKKKLEIFFFWIYKIWILCVERENIYLYLFI